MLSQLLCSHSDHYSIAIFLEPHIPLVKSRALFRLYKALRYQLGNYEEIILELEQEAKRDYRLQKVMDKLIEKLTKND